MNIIDTYVAVTLLVLVSAAGLAALGLLRRPSLATSWRSTTVPGPRATSRSPRTTATSRSAADNVGVGGGDLAQSRRAPRL